MAIVWQSCGFVVQTLTLQFNLKVREEECGWNESAFEDGG
jgi:hypothetical protein